MSARTERSAKPAMIAGVCLLALITLLFSGSRGGLLIGVMALGVGTALYVSARRRAARDGRDQGLGRQLPLAGAIVVIALIAAFFFSRSASFDRLVNLAPSDEIRAQVFPQIVAMAQDNWLFGTGFGAFEYAYRAYESADWLNQTYLNNAHNDWMQWIIEGGLPAMLILVGFVLWIARVSLRHWRERGANPARSHMIAMALGVLLLLLVASALDYPLRVPSMMLYAVMMVALVADPPEPRQKAGRKTPARGTRETRNPPIGGGTEWKGAVT